MGVDDILAKPDLSALQVDDPQGLYQLDNYRISESIGYLFKRVVAVVSTALDQELAVYDITHQQFAILMLLTESSCSTAADIARTTCGDTGAMTRMLDRLEAKDIVRRVRSSADRRIVNIELTDAGKTFASKMPIVAINVLNCHLHGFDAAELELLKTFMRRILSNGGAPLAPSADTQSAAPTSSEQPL